MVGVGVGKVGNHVAAICVGSTGQLVCLWALGGFAAGERKGLDL